MADNDPFLPIQQAAQCLFAAGSRLETAPAYDGTDPRRGGELAATCLRSFASRVDDDWLDGLVIELTDARLGATVEVAAQTMRAVLEGVLSVEGRSLETGLVGVEGEHWWFRAFGTRWFVLTFAPCYPPCSPRSTEGSTSTFVLLQPVQAFDRHSAPSGSTIPEDTRREISRRYASAGRPYDTRLAAQNVESLKFVWPLRPGDPAIRWWSTNSGTFVGEDPR
jgi:hypothetical protein